MYTAIALPMTLFGFQLALNCAWSFLFFGLRSPGLGLIGIILLLAAILATMTAFGRVRPLAGWLLLPYLLWVGYAAALNFAIWRMNCRHRALGKRLSSELKAVPFLPVSVIAGLDPAIHETVA